MWLVTRSRATFCIAFVSLACILYTYVRLQNDGEQDCATSPHTEVHHVSSAINLRERHVDVVLLLDKIHVGVANLMTSIFANTNSDVTVHVGVCGEMTVETLRSYLACYTIPNFDHHKNLRVFTINEDWLLEVGFDTYSRLITRRRTWRPDLASCGNYMRFFLPRLLPDVQRMVYMDTDMIVQGDVAELDYYTQHSNTTIMVTKRMNDGRQLQTLFPPQVQLEYDANFKGVVFNMSEIGFNAGLFLADLNRWRGIYNETIRRIQFWISVAEKHSAIKDVMRWWTRPTQCLMQLVFNGDYSWIPDQNWQSDGLGYINSLCDVNLVRAKLLHWNGGRKPWSPKRKRYHAYWSTHTPLQCQGRGQCSKHDQLYTCDCQQGFYGTQCQLFATKNYKPFSKNTV